MLDHVSITVSDLGRAGWFYDAVMAALGHPCVRREADMLGYGIRNRAEDDGHSYISVRATGDAITADRRHWCFRAPSREAVDAFHAAGLLTTAPTTARPASGPAITRPITRRSCSTRTATGSRRCATNRHEHADGFSTILAMFGTDGG